MQKPSIPEGTRDFGPEQVRKRSYIFDTVRAVFVKFGFQPLETPAMENLSTLTGKYGEEGDKLLFKILNNGDFLANANADALAAKNSAKLTASIAKRGLRYDLTVPFARYVVMNRGTLSFPFKRYQIQPVWRADRPQRGRYREFFQCDVDVIGSDSLHFEAELVQIYDEAFAKLNLPVVIKINNRKVLFGIAEVAGIAEQFTDMTVAIDKLDKVGLEGVRKELGERGISPGAISIIEKILQTTDIQALKPMFASSEIGLAGLAELERVFQLLSKTSVQNELRFDITLARGLSYYTGCIFEVVAKDYQMGSIGGGGRYADLTGVFGVPGLSGVGVSFGADRIYDVLEGLKLFPETLNESVKILLASFDEPSFEYAFECATELRQAGVSVEIYPEPGKLKKQFEYAAKRGIPFVAILGDKEMETKTLAVKDQKTGEQWTASVADVAWKLKNVLPVNNDSDMKYNEKTFLTAIGEAFKNYKTYGSKSPQKLKPIHSYIAELLHDIWGNGFEVHFLGETSKEKTVEGKYYPKNVDIALTKDGIAVFCLGIKFVTSNYKQNANNYFENMMGETANIQAQADLPYAQLLILRHKTPYYEKNETENPSKIETINEKDLSKYLKLTFDTRQAHRPYMMGVLLVDINEDTNTVEATDLKTSFAEDFAILLANKLSLRCFFQEIEAYQRFYQSQK